MTQVKGQYTPRAKLIPESLNRLARVVIRVLAAGSFTKPSGRNETSLTYWLSTQEPPDHIMFLTRGDLGQLVKRLGDETDTWPGQRVVLELINRSYEGRSYEKYAVAPAEEWDDVLRPLDAPPPSSGRKPRTVAPPPSAKRAAKRAPRKPRKRGPKRG